MSRKNQEEIMSFDDIKLEPEHTILGIVAEPDQPDCSGQILSREEIAEAMTLYNSLYKNILVQHRDLAGKEPNFDIAENIIDLPNWNYTYNPEKIKIINSFQTSENTIIENQSVIAGTWLLELQINDEALQKAIDENILTGLSYGGAGRVIPVNSHSIVNNLICAEISLVDRACNKRQFLKI